MSSVGYISRDMTGTTVQGVFAEGTPAHLNVSQTKDISLNLGRSAVESYARHGADLHIVLADGQTLVLDNFFSYGATGGKNLFLSADGQFIEVVLEDKVAEEHHGVDEKAHVPVLSLVESFPAVACLAVCVAVAAS